MHTYMFFQACNTHGAYWEVGYYMMKADYNSHMSGMSGMAGGGYWPNPALGGGAVAPVIQIPVISVWVPLSKHNDENSAIARVSLLNGGSGKVSA